MLDSISPDKGGDGKQEWRTMKYEVLKALQIRPRDPLQVSLPYLLSEPACEEGVEVFSIKPHKALQILPLVDVSLVLLLRQF